MKIAIDGPAGAGKSTAGKRLAGNYGLFYLESGYLYRAFGLAAIHQKIDTSRPSDIENFAATLSAPDVLPLLADEERILAPDVSQIVPQVARIGKVRATVDTHIRDIANIHAEKGIVCSGRDIGARVLTDARLKIFMDADQTLRAQRRHAELCAKTPGLDWADTFNAVARRDEKDRANTIVAPKAVVIDTTNATPDQVYKRVEGLYLAALNRR